MALQGTLDTFALPDVLRLLAATKKTGRLRVSGGRGNGSVWVDGGYVVSTEASGLRPDGPVDVVFELLRYGDGAFTFDADKVAPYPGTPSDVEPLLVEAEQLLAEWRDIEAVVPSLDAWVALVPELPRPDVVVDAERWRAIVAVGSGAEVRRVGDALELGEVAVSRQVKELVEMGLVTVGTAPAAPAAPAPAAPAFPAPALAPVPAYTADPYAAAAPEPPPHHFGPEGEAPAAAYAVEAPAPYATDDAAEPEHRPFEAATTEPAGDDAHGDHGFPPVHAPEPQPLRPAFGSFDGGAGRYEDEGQRPALRPAFGAHDGGFDGGDDADAEPPPAPLRPLFGGEGEYGSPEPEPEFGRGPFPPAGPTRRTLARPTPVDNPADDAGEVARQLAGLSPKAARAVAAAAQAETDEEREAALAEVTADADEPINRGLLLKFLSSVRS